jgi:hypothetical protein
MRCDRLTLRIPAASLVVSTSAATRNVTLRRGPNLGDESNQLTGPVCDELLGPSFTSTIEKFHVQLENIVFL